MQGGVQVRVGPRSLILGLIRKNFLSDDGGTFSKGRIKAKTTTHVIIKTNYN